MSEAPILHVAGRDRSADLGPKLARSAALRADRGLAAQVARESVILDLRSAAGTGEYLGRHMDLLRARNQVDPSSFEGPRPAGLTGRIRRLLWALLRYQHDWVSFRQNAVNVQLSYELEFEKEERRKQVAALEKRIHELEKRGTS